MDDFTIVYLTARINPFQQFLSNFLLQTFSSSSTHRPAAESWPKLINSHSSRRPTQKWSPSLNRNFFFVHTGKISRQHYRWRPMNNNLYIVYVCNCTTQLYYAIIELLSRLEKRVLPSMTVIFFASRHKFSRAMIRA